MMADPNTPPPTARSKAAKRFPTGNTANLQSRLTATSGPIPRSASSSRLRASSASSQESAGGGGLSVTGTLADFSLFVFHPYGHGSKKSSLSLLENTSFKRNKHAESSASPLTDTGRKDSLSLNVEFVKVNISRSRKGIVDPAKLSEYKTKAANTIRFSAVCDIGSASFKYDMRRLSEILALPKAWYRRTLARRVFLGEESGQNILDDSDISDISTNSTPASPDTVVGFMPVGRAQTTSSINMSHLTDTPAPQAKTQTHRRVASEDRNVPISLDFKRELDDIHTSRSPSGSGSTPQTPSDEAQKTASPSKQKPGTLRSSTLKANSKLKNYEHLTQPRSAFKSTVTPGHGKQTLCEWETLVLFSANLSRLDVNVNMSNVMGNCTWATQDLKSQGRFCIDSSGYKDMKISSGFKGSKLEARGGIVGGNIELHTVHTAFYIAEDPCTEPEHRCQMELHTLEIRLDYMGSSVLMGRLSTLVLGLKDEWGLDLRQLRKNSQHLPRMSSTNNSTAVLVRGDLNWDKFHLMISRSTTPDLLKMASKLEEFLQQQLSSSKRVLSAFAPIPARSSAKPPRRKSMFDGDLRDEILHHRHWQKVLERVSGCQLSMLTFRLPEEGTSLGGTITLQGNNLTLSCFHGINFRAKSWAIFSLDEVFIEFATDAQAVPSQESSGSDTRVSQKLSINLGRNRAGKIDERPMAQICKLSRGHYMPPPFTSVADWFAYALGSAELKHLDCFPQVPPAGSETPTERRAASRKAAEYNHETETIFALPTLLMHLETVHIQGEQQPSEDDPAPQVECSFVTEFEDHIFVAMDAEAILFVHDLIRNYVKEKDRGVRTSYRSGQSPEPDRKIITDPTAALKEDLREFVCKSWRLEPTIRLLSWAGKRIDPVGVDYILQKLGFQHARLTIPKWMQRGAMDPLDKILSVLVDKLICALKETTEER